MIHPGHPAEGDGVVAGGEGGELAGGDVQPAVTILYGPTKVPCAWVFTFIAL